jgi:hypothetical protein
MTEKFVEQQIIKWLSKNGWGTNLEFSELHKHGVDIKVRNNNFSRYFLVECKGEGKSRSSNEVAFIYSLGQILTRMNVGKARYYYGIGLPFKAANIALRRLPWQVARKLLLSVFAVYSDGEVKRHTWQDLKEHETVINERKDGVHSNVSYKHIGRSRDKQLKNIYHKSRTSNLKSLDDIITI